MTVGGQSPNLPQGAWVRVRRLASFIEGLGVIQPYFLVFLRIYRFSYVLNRIFRFSYVFICFLLCFYLRLSPFWGRGKSIFFFEVV